MRLYHFAPMHFALSDIALQRMKIARLGELNDPFELLAADLSDPHLRTVLNSVKRQLGAENGVLCFSKTWKNPIMWSHYATQHSGICLGLDIDDSVTIPVTYSANRVSISRNVYMGEVDEAALEDAFRDVLGKKYVGWQYEEEVRVYVGLDHSTAERGLYFKDFDDGMRLKEVILGVGCELPIATVERLVSSTGSDAEVFRAALADGSFEIVRATNR